MRPLTMLEVRNLKVAIAGKEILKGIDLMIKPGEAHVLMGPNGSGKSTLAQVLMGSSQFTVESSQLSFNGKDLTKLTPDKRAKLGIFLAFQHPVEVPGVSVFNFLRKAKQSQPSLSLRAKRSNLDSGFALRLRSGQLKGSESYRTARMTGEKIATSSLDKSSTLRLRPDGLGTPRNDISGFREELLEYASSLKLSDDCLRRSLNEGFSGGEKKRNEILQMMALAPKLAILDEIDSGLDVDGLNVVASAIKHFAVSNKQSAILLITHYARILKYLKPDFVHVMVEGKIVKSGKMSLAREIEEKGYRSFSMSS